MRGVMDISRVRFTASSKEAQKSGLLGFVSLVLDDSLQLDGVAVRRTLAGELALSFPARRDGKGRKHPYMRPIDDGTRRDLERQVFAALGLEEVAR